jgi:hypothetical protein
MRLSLPRQDLTRLLTAVTKVVEARSTIPILGNVLLSVQDGQFSARATDLDIEVSTSIPVLDATNGSTTVNAKLLADIAKRAAGDVSLELADGTLTVKSGRSRFKLATLPVEDFPSLTSIWRRWLHRARSRSAQRKPAIISMASISTPPKAGLRRLRRMAIGLAVTMETRSTISTASSSHASWSASCRKATSTCHCRPQRSASPHKTP